MKFVTKPYDIAHITLGTSLLP